MAKNLYFADKSVNEQNLYEDIIIESLKIYGQDVYYMPREIVNEDKIFGEDVPSRFSTSYKIEMYIENQQGFDGEGDLFSKFGVEIRDAATFIVSRRRWRHMIGQNSNIITEERPREGDIIYLPLSNSMFEIMHVEHELPFYQLSNVPTYSLRCELFRYSSEDFDTGIATIDGIEGDAYNITLNLDSGFDSGGEEGVLDFFVGETVYQLDSSILSVGGNFTKVTGEVVSYNAVSCMLELTHIGTDSAIASGQGNSSGLIGFTRNKIIINDRANDALLFPPYAFYGRDIDSDQVIDARTRRILSIVSESDGYISGQNDVFDANDSGGLTGFVDFLDFSEGNPFGDAEDL